MAGALLALAIVCPIGGLILLYRLLNKGEYPCVNTNFTRVFVSENN